jgi:hypothetical protein
MNDHFGFLLFFGNLVEVYIQGGSQAGTYTSGDGGRAWTKQ